MKRGIYHSPISPASELCCRDAKTVDRRLQKMTITVAVSVSCNGDSIGNTARYPFTAISHREQLREMIELSCKGERTLGFLISDHPRGVRAVRKSINHASAHQDGGVCFSFITVYDRSSVRDRIG